MLRQFAKIIKDNFESVFILCDYVSLVGRMLRLGHTNDEIKYHLEYAEKNGEFDTWKLTTHVIKSLPSDERMLLQALGILGLPKNAFQERIGKR